MLYTNHKTCICKVVHKYSYWINSKTVKENTEDPKKKKKSVEVDEKILYMALGSIAEEKWRTMGEKI